MANFKTYDVTLWLTKQLQYTHCPLSQEVKTDNEMW